MKKIIAFLVLSLSIMVAMLGCDKKSEGDDKGTDISPTPEVSVEDEENGEGGEDEEGVEEDTEDMEEFIPEENPVVKEDYDYNDYIKLGKYKGIEVNVVQKEVTEDHVDAAIQMALLESGATANDVSNRAAISGDTLNIDFVGYHNGEAFEGGSAEGFELTLGSNRFIDGFEDQLIGAELNTEVDVNVVFPEGYNNDALSGEPALFKVKINGIQNFDLTDDFVKDTMGFDTEEEYRVSLREELVKFNTDNIKSKKENDIYTAVIDGSEIEMPSNLLDYYESDIKTLYNNIAASYDMDLEGFVTASGYSVDSFEEDVKEYAENMVTRELVIKAISNTENIELTEDEFQTKVTEYVEEYGYESNEAFLEEAEIDVLKDDLLFNKVIQFLVAESIEL